MKTFNQTKFDATKAKVFGLPSAKKVAKKAVKKAVKKSVPKKAVKKTVKKQTPYTGAVGKITSGRTYGVGVGP